MLYLLLYLLHYFLYSYLYLLLITIPQPIYDLKWPRIAPHVIYHMCFIYIKTYLYIQYNKFVFFITHAFSRQFYSKYFDNSDQNWWPFSSVWIEPLLPLVDVNSDSRSSGRMNFELFIDWYLGLSIVRKNFGPTENPMHKRGNTLMWILKDLNSLGVNYSWYNHSWRWKRL